MVDSKLQRDDGESNGHKSGFVTLVGQPNVGKSTLLNGLIGTKLAITSHRPQTTRNRIPGVLTRDNHQLVFVDTPGLHSAQRALNSFMVDVAKEAVWDTDVVALVVEAGIGPDETVGVSEVVQDLVSELSERSAPVVLVLNKIDRVSRDMLLPIIDHWQSVARFGDIVPISALEGDGLEALEEVLVGYMPDGPALYPEDFLTDLPERFIASELIREQLFRQLRQEVPYAVAVTIETWKELGGASRVDIGAIIHVERESQKGIVIGRGGSTLKSIGVKSRKALERLLDIHVNLKLFVKVEPDWTRSVVQMRKLGYKP